MCLPRVEVVLGGCSTVAFRGVAQIGRALGLGPRCRRFKSFHPDHFSLNNSIGRNADL